MTKIISNITYHNVSPGDPAIHPMLTVSPAQFANEMNWLARHHYSPIYPSEWAAWLLEKRPLPKKPVLITFDDGYANITQYAFPILKRYSFKAAAYLVTGLIGKTNEWDRREGWGKLDLMTERQIIDWAADGVEFGAHTRNHVDLRSLSQEDLEQQVFGCQADLQRIFGAPPTSFAYPFGHFNRDIRDCVARAFNTGLTTEEALCTDEDDLLLMPRIWVRPGEGLAKFAQRVKFAEVLTFRQRFISRKRLRRVITFCSKLLSKATNHYDEADRNLYLYLFTKYARRGQHHPGRG